MALKTFLGICLLRAGPQELPSSPMLLRASLVAYVFADVVGVLDTMSPGRALLAAVVDTALLTAVTHLVLRWRNLENRFSQTLTALASSGAMLSLLAWAAVGLTQEMFSAQWVWALFLLWYTFVFGHIVRHALSVSLAVGVAASLLYLILSMGVTGMFVSPVSMEH